MLNKRINVRMNQKNRQVCKFKVKQDQGRFVWGTPEGGYLVVPDRVRYEKGKPFLEYVEGNAEPIDPYGKEVHITAEEMNEHIGNRYVQQVMSMVKNALATNLQWILIGVVALAALAEFYFSSKTNDHITALGNQVAALQTQLTPPVQQGGTVVTHG